MSNSPFVNRRDFLKSAAATVQLPMPHRQFFLFSKNKPPLQNKPQIRYLLLSDVRRLLAY